MNSDSLTSVASEFVFDLNDVAFGKRSSVLLSKALQDSLKKLSQGAIRFSIAFEYLFLKIVLEDLFAELVIAVVQKLDRFNHEVPCFVLNLVAEVVVGQEIM